MNIASITPYSSRPSPKISTPDQDENKTPIQKQGITTEPVSASNTNEAAATTKPEEKQVSAPALTPSELDQIDKLKARDSKVRSHEAAHKAAAGAYARGGASYTFQRGSDGSNYAIGGNVQIDTSPISGDPEATLRKAETIQRAASAPAQPSAQDNAVAAAATQMANDARADVLQQLTASTTSEEKPYQKNEVELDNNPEQKKTSHNASNEINQYQNISSYATDDTSEALLDMLA